MSEFTVKPRTDIGLPAKVLTSSGRNRPKIRLCDYLTIHYTGVKRQYKNSTPRSEILNIEGWASQKDMPNEYNYVIAQNDDNIVYEYAGPFRAAHCRGWNSNAVGVLLLNGIDEPPTSQQIRKVQWLRDVLRYFGVLDPNPVTTGHGFMPGARTRCPGGLIQSRIEKFEQPYLATPEPEPEPSTGYALHTIAQANDGLWSIANRVYGQANASNIEALRQANPDLVLHPGTKVAVPGKATL